VRHADSSQRSPDGGGDRLPVTYLVFDIMHLDGRDLLRTPYAQRRAQLEDLGLPGPDAGVPPSFPGGGQAVLAASREHGLEGVVLKRLDSLYLPGRRSPLWLKVKNEWIADVVIGGWIPGHGARAAVLGSLLLGVQARAGLAYCGKAGTGFTDAALRDLTRGLRALEQPRRPFASPVPPADARHARWARPVLAGRVSYTEWTPAGRLRHPVWRGLRASQDPARVIRGLPAGGTRSGICARLPPAKLARAYARISTPRRTSGRT
jgi:bifunctional non-homologous end joining protein LigD